MNIKMWKSEDGMSSKRKTCMKHKKKDKPSKEKTIVSEKSKIITKKSKLTDTMKQKKLVTAPSDASQFSSNWKKLLNENTELKDEQRRAKKRKQQIAKGVDEKTEKESKKLEVWFDDVDEFLIEGLQTEAVADDNKTEEVLVAVPVKRSKVVKEGKEDTPTNNPLVKADSFKGVTRALALDCEMVGVGDGGEESILARVSLVNQFGSCVYDTFVRPTERVTDYRTEVSGVRSSDMINGEEFSVAQKKVSELLKGRLLVGHAVENDLKVLFLDHPRKQLRDTQRYPPFRSLFNGSKPALKKLTEKLLKVPIQAGEHNSIQDAQATMRLYTMFRQQWEKDIKSRKGPGMMRPKKKPKRYQTKA